MVYVKNSPAWNNDDPNTPLAEDRLNHMETQYDEAKTYTDAQVTALAGQTSDALRTKVNSSTYTTGMNLKANLADLAAVAQTGSYSDLANKPTIPTDYVTDAELEAALEGVEPGSNTTTVIGAARSQLAAPAFGSSVTNRGANRSVATSYGTTNLIETTRVRHVLTENAASIHLVFMGWYGGEADQVDATIKATIETATGSLHKLTFRGSRTHLLTTGSYITSDPLGLVLKKGDIIWVRTTRTITTGTYYANTVLRGTNGEGKTLTDVADSGTITAATDDTTTGGYTAAAVVSSMPSIGNSVVIIGDSVSNGKGEGYFDANVPPVFIPVEERGGYMLRSLPDSVGVLRLNAGGGNASTFIGNTVNAGGSRRRMPFAASARYAWVEYGINDVSAATDAQGVKDTLIKLWTALAESGLKVYQSTLTVWSQGSTDGYITLENQTLWAKHAIRIEINDWIRTLPAPLTGYFEMADQVESSRNSGKWRVDLGALTTDGIHPNTLGHTTIATNLSSAVTGAFTYVATSGGGTGSTSIAFQDTSGNVLTGRHLVIRVNTATGTIDDILVSTGPDSSAPTTPGTPTATAGVGQNVISWSASTDNIALSAYRVYRSDAATTILATTTSPNYTDTAPSVGTAYTYTVDAIDTTGNVSAKSASSNSVTATAPVIVNNVAPTISGTATEGETLTASTGTWTPAADSYTYQWKRAGTNISGATANTYVLITADVGNSITVSVTGVKSGYTSATATSTGTATVTPVGGTALNNTVAPVISGSNTTGSTLTGTTGTWSATPDSYTYQWKRAGGDISGATANTYVLQVADEGQAVTVAVTAIKSGYTSGTASSNSITGAPASSGTAFLTDTFTDANGGLQAHTSESGATWAINSATSAGAALITNNRARAGNTTTTVFVASAIPPSPDYSVEADFVFLSLPAGGAVGISGRTSPSLVQYYGLRYSVGSANWALIKQSGGVSLATIAHTPTVGQTYRVKLTMTGSTITGTISGGDLSAPLIITQTDANNTTAGQVGLTFSGTTASSATVGIHIDNLTATS